MATIYADIDIASGRMKLDGSFTDRDDANVVLRGFSERYMTVMTLDVVLNGKTIASAVTFEQKDDDVVAAVDMDTECVRRMSRAVCGPSQVGVSVVLNESNELVAKGRSIVLLNWEEQPGGGGGEVIGAVESVNGKTGVVVLDANDVGAQQVLGTAQSAAVNSGITSELVARIGVDAVTSVNGMTGDVNVTSDDIMDGDVTVKESIEDIVDLISAHIADNENPHGVTAEQVGARPDTWMPTASEVGARPSDWMPSAEDVGARPDDWMPTAEDIGAQTELSQAQLDAVNSGITSEKVAKIDSISAVSSVNGKTGVVVLKASDVMGFGGVSGNDVSVEAKVSALANDVSAHVESTSNPHNVTAEQVGARPSTWMPTAADVGARPNTWTPTAADVGARPSTWTPTASDVGARPNTWLPLAGEILNENQMFAANSGITAPILAQIIAKIEEGGTIIGGDTVRALYGGEKTVDEIVGLVNVIGTFYRIAEDGTFQMYGHLTVEKGDFVILVQGDTELEFVKFGSSGGTEGALTADDVVPKGSGTYTIATIGGKDIKAPTGGGGGSVVESETNPGYAANADRATTADSAASAGIAYYATEAQAATQAVRSVSAESVPWGGVTDTPTTVAGYGITDAAKTSDVDSAKAELNARIDLIEATSHPNMTIVGAPTFREGNVSGFSANDYLVFPTAVSVGQNTVEFHMAFHTGSDVNTQQNIMDSWCGLAFAIRNGTTVTAISTNGTSFLAESTGGTIRANNSYRMKMLFSYEDGQYRTRVYLADGAGDFVEVGTGFTADAPVYATATYWGGANPGHDTHAFGGIINLNECRMLVNGVEVWRGYDELPTVKFDPTATPRLDTAEKIAAQSAYPMAAVVGGTLKDRTINYWEGDGVFSFPPGGSNARDFVLVVGVGTGDAPSITFLPSGVTYFSDDENVWTAEARKVNAWYFTEINGGQFMVSHKALAAVSQ